MNNEIKDAVRKAYGEIARQGGSCCGSSNSCCGPSNSCCGGTTETDSPSKMVGYSDADLKIIPEGADLGLGCGNPVALASIKEGETVLDLGSGAGLDCFLSSPKVGQIGRVIGVDMTPEMIQKARQNAAKGNFSNVEFRLGEIENLPVADDSVDLVISNCVINLSPDKSQVFKETFRVLRPRGRLMVSDIVLQKELPVEIKNSVEAYVSCIAGAELKTDYLKKMAQAGFIDIQVVDETCLTFEADSGESGETVSTENQVISVKISAIKPAKT
jgi:arsenite methyltransferase